MIKKDLISYLNEHFNEVIVNDRFTNPINSDQLKSHFELVPESLDDKCFINVADIIARNNKNQIFYFVYYSKKDAIMIYDKEKKCINIQMPNNVMKHYQYKDLLKRVKKYINKSNSFLIFFSCGQVDFNEPIKNHIFILNEENIDYYLSKYFDTNNF